MNVSSLNLSLFLAFPLYSNVDSDRCWFVAQNWIITPQNGHLLQDLSSEWINHFPLQDDMIRPSVLIICSDSWIFCLLICTPLSLFHSPRNGSRRHSLFMRVPSPSDTHYLNRHTAWYGCHEILIPHSLTLLFLLNFSLYSIQLWFWWLSYSNYAFQLISIQYRVHHSDSARNHQSCYQEPFISTSNGWQAHIQRQISCSHSNKARAFIALTVYRVHSLAKSKALAAPERSQNYLRNDRKYRAHILDRI